MSLTNYIAQAITAPYSPASTVNYPVEYFSGCDTSIFFNDQYIDEITDFRFSLREKILPIYSYANYTPNKIIHGSRVVMGQFTTNLRSGDYLHEMLYQQVQSDISAGIQVGLPVNTVSGVQPDPSTNPAGFAAWVQNQKNTFWQTVQSSGVTSEDALASSPYFMNNGFSILIVYGDLDSTDLSRNTGRVRSIDNIHIWSVDQRVGLEPEQITETWQFAAFDINNNNRTVATPTTIIAQ